MEKENVGGREMCTLENYCLSMTIRIYAFIKLYFLKKKNVYYVIAMVKQGC